MDTAFIEKYYPLYVKAAGLTLRLGLTGVLLSLAVGLLCSLVLYYRVPIAKRAVQAYIELSRNTPLLVQLFFLYFGLPKIGVVISAEGCAIVGLTFLGGSYMCEALRSGMQAVAPIQAESALSLGMTKAQAMRHVVLPQAISYSVPGLCANVVFLIKETSVFSAVALADLMFVAKDLIGMYYKTNEALLMLVIAYVVILLPVSLAAMWLERRLRHAGFGN